MNDFKQSSNESTISPKRLVSQSGVDRADFRLFEDKINKKVNEGLDRVAEIVKEYGQKWSGLSKRVRELERREAQGVPAEKREKTSVSRERSVKIDTSKDKLPMHSPLRNKKLNTTKSPQFERT